MDKPRNGAGALVNECEAIFANGLQREAGPGAPSLIKPRADFGDQRIVRSDHEAATDIGMGCNGTHHPTLKDKVIADMSAPIG